MKRQGHCTDHPLVFTICLYQADLWSLSQDVDLVRQGHGQPGEALKQSFEPLTCWKKEKTSPLIPGGSVCERRPFVYNRVSAARNSWNLVKWDTEFHSNIESKVPLVPSALTEFALSCMI